MRMHGHHAQLRGVRALKRGRKDGARQIGAGQRRPKIEGRRLAFGARGRGVETLTPIESELDMQMDDKKQWVRKQIGWLRSILTPYFVVKPVFYLLIHDQNNIDAWLI
jgi:hypothetical protein